MGPLVELGLPDITGPRQGTAGIEKVKPEGMVPGPKDTGRRTGMDLLPTGSLVS